MNGRHASHGTGRPILKHAQCRGRREVKCFAAGDMIKSLLARVPLYYCEKRYDLTGVDMILKGSLRTIGQV